MKFQFFLISTLDSEMQINELNTFCAQHRVVDIEKQFVSDGAKSFWSFCVSYIDHEGSLLSNSSGLKKRKPRIDYKEVLNDDDFTLYSQLRDLRKEIAEKEGTPAYNVFTNEQLANIVQQRITTKTALMSLENVGQKRVEKYAQIFISKLKELL